ncbi:MAG: hypothetical protein WBP96_02515 [Nitrososphaeraceae archaeon]
MESGKDEKTVEGSDENLLMQRLCEAFKKAKDGGQKHVTVSDFQDLKNQGVQKGIIEIDTNVIRPTPHAIEKFKEIDSSFQW